MKYIYVFILLFSLPCLVAGQVDNRVWYDGNSRAMFYRDALSGESKDQDTTSARSNGEGYTAIDLGIHFNPSKEIEIFSEIRIKNDFGYMWGSGAYVELRRLSVRGVLNDRVSFNLGDIYLKQTSYTLYNNLQELSKNEPSVFNSYRDLINYENYYQENFWRTQGIQSNFSYTFYNAIKSVELDGFASRVRGNQWLGKPELLMLGGTSVLRLENNLKFSANFINSFEVQSTSLDSLTYNNPVYNIQGSYFKKLSMGVFFLKLDVGASSRSWSKTNGSEETFIEDKGNFLKLKGTLKNTNNTFGFAFKYTDPNFRSSGAQTKRIIYNSSLSTYPYYTNNTLLRPVSLLDITTDPNIYNQRLSTTLMSFNPKYGAVNPYGDATPNRVGVSGDYKFKNNKIETSLVLNLFSEVIGQGTTNNRSLFSSGASIRTNLEEFIKIKNKTTLELSSYLEAVNRGGNNVESISFNSSLLSAGLSYELFKDLKIIAGAKVFLAKGNEFETERNEYDQITGYNIKNYDSEENIYLIGLQYSFSKDIYFSLQSNKINIVNQLIEQDRLALSRIYFMFNMNL